MLLILPDPPRRIPIDGQLKTPNDRIPGFVQNVPLQDALVRVMQNQTDVVEADNAAKSFGYTRNQRIQIGPSGNTAGERQNGLVNIA